MSKVSREFSAGNRSSSIKLGACHLKTKVGKVAASSVNAMLT